MKNRLLIFIVIIYISGCATYVDYFAPTHKEQVDYDADIKGFSKTAIVRDFGEPHLRKSNFRYGKRTDKWSYFSKEGLDMYITFVNGRVSDVVYE